MSRKLVVSGKAKRPAAVCKHGNDWLACVECDREWRLSGEARQRTRIGNLVKR
jgi:hypothetical protein